MSLADRIRDDIAARIRSGEWRPGDRVPFEHELVARYGCARGTANKALVALARSGFIERRRKAGSFVAHPQVHSAVLEVPDLSAAITARGEAYRWQRTALAPVDAADPLGAPAMRIEGVHWGGGRPFALEQRLISLAAAPAVTHEPFEAEAPGSWLLHHVPWTSARHRIRAIAPSAVEARLLAVARHTPCLELERITWRGAQPVTHARQLFPGDRYDLVAEFTPDAR